MFITFHPGTATQEESIFRKKKIHLFIYIWNEFLLLLYVIKIEVFSSPLSFWYKPNQASIELRKREYFTFFVKHIHLVVWLLRSEVSKKPLKSQVKHMFCSRKYKFFPSASVTCPYLCVLLKANGKKMFCFFLFIFVGFILFLHLSWAGVHARM